MSPVRRRGSHPAESTRASWMDVGHLVKRQSSFQGQSRNDSTRQTHATQTTSVILDSGLRNLAIEGDGGKEHKTSKTENATISATKESSDSSSTSSHSKHKKEKSTGTATTTQLSTSSQKESPQSQVTPTPTHSTLKGGKHRANPNHNESDGSSESNNEESLTHGSSTDLEDLPTPSARRKVVTGSLTQAPVLFAPTSSLTALATLPTGNLDIDTSIAPSGTFFDTTSAAAAPTKTKKKCSTLSGATVVPAAATAASTLDVGTTGDATASSISSSSSSSPATSAPSAGRNVVIAGSVVGASVALALLALLFILFRRGKIRKVNLGTFESPFSRFRPNTHGIASPPPTKPMGSPISRFQFPWNKAKSPVIPSPRAETYDAISRQNEKSSILSSPRQSSEASTRGRTSEVLEIDPDFMQHLSPVQEEGSSVYSSNPRSTLAYPESILTRSSDVMPSARSSGLLPSARSSSSRTVLLPSVAPTTPRRASDPFSPLPPESIPSMVGPWRDSMWSVAMTPSGITPHTSVYPSNRPDSTHRVSKSLSAAYDCPAPLSILTKQGGCAQTPVSGGSPTPMGDVGAYPTHQRHRAVPHIPSLFLGEQGTSMGSITGGADSQTANTSTLAEFSTRMAPAQGLPGALPNGQPRRQNSGSTVSTTATPRVFKEHPGNLVHF